MVKLMQNVEKRFPTDNDLNGQFLELVNYIYRDESLSGSELTSKLEPAFLAGLRCSQPHVREKFFEVRGEDNSHLPLFLKKQKSKEIDKMNLRQKASDLFRSAIG